MTRSTVPAPGKKGNSGTLEAVRAKIQAKAEKETPYATLMISFFRGKPFVVSGEHVELLTPGGVHKIMPRVYKEMRRLRGKATFDVERLEREARQQVVGTIDEPPVKIQTHIPEQDK